MIKAIALHNDILLESRDHMGPVSILRGKNGDNFIELASSVTVRYSDAPREEKSFVSISKGKENSELNSECASEESYIKFRI